jgi:hypothetical protein
MAVTADDIMQDVKATCAGIPGVTAIVWPPGEQGPVQGPELWLEYGPVSYELGSLETAYHTITIGIVTPRKGSSPQEYLSVVAIGKKVIEAFRGNALVSGEAAIQWGTTVSKPAVLQYPNDPQPFYRCDVVMTVETQEEVVNQIAP